MARKTGRTLRLSKEGIEKAKTAFLKFNSEADLAAQISASRKKARGASPKDTVGMSRGTVHKFLKGEPVQRKEFYEICKKLGLKEVADLPRITEAERGETNQDNCADIDELVREVRSRRCDKIQDQYSKIQLLNRQQIDIDKLYVDVYVLKKLTSESYAKIHDLLKDSNYRDNFDRLGLGQRGKRSPGFEIAAHHPRLMILGKPGSGKTTFLRHLAVACCKGEFLADYIPILIELRGINASEFNLFNSIHQEFDLPNEEQTKQILNLGKTVILLDGLDEVPSQSRLDVQDHIYKFPLQQQYYKNRFVLTCRTQTTDYISDKFQCVEVAEFKPEQVDEFAQNWFASFAETAEQAARLTANFLNKLRLPENQPTAELAVTPILLSLTCWVFTDLKDLPAKRSDLYEQGINLLLQKWDDKRGIRRDSGTEHYRNLSIAQKRKLLSYLAAQKFEQEQFVLFEESEIQRYIAEYLDISIEESQEVLKAIEAHHGLLIERAQDIWSFSHLTFQEYFAAKWFCDRADYQGWEGLVKYITEKYWREVFLLTVEMRKGTNGLFQLMKERIDTLIAAEKKLQEFLTKVNQKSLSIQSSFRPMVIRAFYFILGLPLIDKLIDRDDGSLQVLDYVDEFDTDSLDEQLSLTGNLPGDLQVDLKLIIDFDPTLNFYMDDFLRHSLQIITNSLPSLGKIDEWEFDRYEWLSENSEWWQVNGKAWAELLRNVIVEHRNIGHDWQFSNHQKELLQQYYDANKLLVECLNSSCRVSDKVRQEIEETLLLPIAEIKKRQQQM